jgi:hypothetical protein
MKSSHIALFLVSISAPAFAEELPARANDDVQILQAWRAGSIELNHERCIGENPSIEQNRIYKDCTEQGTLLNRASWAGGVDSPSATPWSLPVINHRGYIYSPAYAGHMVEIRALVKRSVLESPSFLGIGFYSANILHDGVHFVPAAQLHVLTKPKSDTNEEDLRGKDVTLKRSNEDVAVLRFVAWLPGWQGNSGTGWSCQGVYFKPFARFSVGENDTVDNWEDRRNNHRIARSANCAGLRQEVSVDYQRELISESN